ncbi:MAG: nitrile hydratase subunit beta [Candidatus Eremiobacteraeota bacterium]|nr:nitrile hydratase subunit beta [Candidatus Eremiobacteraeota bacterium]
MFSVGDHVRTKTRRHAGHTRLPHYLEQRDGRVVAELGDFRLADEGAVRGAAASREYLYTVEFVVDGHYVCADLFESYLEPKQ